MGSFVLFIIIAYLFKRGLIDGRGLSDVAKILGGIFAIIAIVSLVSSPAFWIFLGFLLLAVITGGIFLFHMLNGKKRAEMYGWDTEEYQAKYAAAVEKFKEMYKAQRNLTPHKHMSATEKRMQDLADEKKAREAAAEEVDAEFRAREAKMKAEGAKTSGGSSGGSAKRTAGSSKTKTTRVKNASSVKVKSKILPKPPAKRTKIVNKFNDLYGLCLTEEQIELIVDASYMSNAWKNEVEAMSDRYDSINQWLYGDTAYLRAYLIAFAVQDVTSDFQKQMQIVMDSFEEVFEYSDEWSSLSIDQRIEKINAKFMTNFDEITYMIAYRYLEALGLKHELDKTTLNRVDGSFDDLVLKYDKMSNEEVDKELEGAKPDSASAN